MDHKLKIVASVFLVCAGIYFLFMSEKKHKKAEQDAALATRAAQTHNTAADTDVEATTVLVDDGGTYPQKRDALIPVENARRDGQK